MALVAWRNHGKVMNHPKVGTSDSQEGFNDRRLDIHLESSKCVIVPHDLSLLIVFDNEKNLVYGSS